MEACEQGSEEPRGANSPVPFTYTVTGSINGEQICVVFEGELANGEVRRTKTSVEPEQPLLWDAEIVWLVAREPLLRLANALDVGEASGDGGELDHGERVSVVEDEFRIESSLYRECDLPVGRFVLVGVCEALSGRVTVRGQLVDGWLDFEPGERVVRSGEADGGGGSASVSVLAGEPGRVVVTRVWSVETSRGNLYSGVSVMRGEVGKARCQRQDDFHDP